MDTLLIVAGSLFTVFIAGFGIGVHFAIWFINRPNGQKGKSPMFGNRGLVSIAIEAVSYVGGLTVLTWWAVTVVYPMFVG